MLAAWQRGEAIRSIELGHTQRMKTVMNGDSRGTEKIDFGKPLLQNRQALTHEWAFHIIGYCAENGVPESHEEFSKMCDFLKGEMGAGELSPEERIGAESLAWKALTVGWNRAIEGLPETRTIMVKRPQ